MLLREATAIRFFDRLEKLAEYIRAHDCDAWIIGGRLYADANEYRDGQHVPRTVELQAAMPAVRAFLGY